MTTSTSALHPAHPEDSTESRGALVRWRKGGRVWLVGKPRPGRLRIAAVLGPRPVHG